MIPLRVIKDKIGRVLSTLPQWITLRVALYHWSDVAERFTPYTHGNMRIKGMEINADGGFVSLEINTKFFVSHI